MKSNKTFRYASIFALFGLLLILFSNIFSSCASGHSTATCGEGWLGNYRCSGDWRQREYRYTDCSREWRDYEHCSYDCSNSACVERETECDLSVSVSTPSDTCLDNNVHATITLTNDGDNGGYVNVHAYLCESDRTDCVEMDYNGATDDPRIYVSGHGKEYIDVTKRANELGDYVIKVVYSGCNADSTDPTIYSSSFNVADCYHKGVYHRGRCEEKYLSAFRCFGRFRQQAYQLEDCSLRWKPLEYCEGECSNGMCIPRMTVTPVYYICPSCAIQPTYKASATYGKALLSLEREYEFKACEISSFNFDLINTGNLENTYTIQLAGAASGWLYMPKSIALAGQEKKSVQAYVKVPCDAKGSNEFTISASSVAAGVQTELVDSLIAVKDESGAAFGQTIFTTPTGLEFWVGLLLILLLLAIVLLFFFAKRFGLTGLLPRRRKCRGRCSAESF